MTRPARFLSASAIALLLLLLSASAHASAAGSPAVRQLLGFDRSARWLELPAASLDDPAGARPARPSAFGGAAARSLSEVLAAGTAGPPRIREQIGSLSSPGASAAPAETDGLGLPYDAINLASAGDTDNNGSTDWVRGEPFFSPPVGVGAGHVTVYQRSSTGTLFTVEINGPEAFAGFGAAVTSAGDVDGDGYDEVIVGAPGFDGQRGRAYVYRGGPAGLVAGLPWTVTGTQPFGYLGYAVAGAGDVNGDGYDDILVGEPGLDTPAFAGGRVYCFHGGPTGVDDLPAWSVSGVQLNEFVGWAVAGNGDVNADGYADVVVGGPGWDNGQSEEGRIRLFLGGPGGLAVTSAWDYETNQANWSAGKALALPGDLDGDGYGDVAVGIHEADFIGTDDGVFLVFGGSPFVFDLPQRFQLGGGESFMNLGKEVTAAGDLNGDGYADAAASGPGYGTNDGGVWVTLYGAPDYGTFGSYLPYFGPDFSGSGTALAGGGDPGNGEADLLVGFANDVGPIAAEPGPDAVNASAGGTSPFLLVTAGVTFDEIGYAPTHPFGQGSWLEERFGQSVAIGDVNGDGFGDAMVGGPDYGDGLHDAGHVLVYYGTSAGFTAPAPFVLSPGAGEDEPAGVLPSFIAPDWYYEGLVDSARFGQSVANAGDVNGDGYDDLIVGAPLASYGEPEEGAAYVFLGGPDGLETQPSWRTEGNAAVNFFGYSVATAGDVNQDGYADVLVGAPLADPGGLEDAGTVSLYYGSPSGLAHVPARVFAGSVANAIMGTSGVGVGDVDGDGYPDIAVHEPYYDAGFDYPGRLYLYRGGAAGPSPAPFYTFGPTAEYGVPGFQLSPAGDVNGDGFADFMASGAHVTKGNAMAVLLFTGSPTGPGPAPTTAIHPDQVASFEGYRMAPAGDMNKDGYGEIAIGSPGYSTVVARTGDPALAGVASDGRVTIHFGTAGGAETSYRLAFSDPGALGEVGMALAGGDVNGDGWPDVVYSAPSANSSKLIDNGVIHVGFANIVSAGLARPVRMLRGDNLTPIAHGLRSDQPNLFRLASQARTPAGRGRVRMQWQVKPPAGTFDGTGIQSSPALRTLTPDEDEGSSILLHGTASGLASGQRYRWRVRHATRHPNFPRSRWTTPTLDGLLHFDLRTAGPTGAVAVGDPPAGPGRALALAGAWPNPLAAGAGGTVHFALPAVGRVTIDAHDAQGRRVTRLFDGEAAAGPGTARWDGRDDAGRALPRGLYFLRLVFADEERTAKVVIAP